MTHATLLSSSYSHYAARAVAARPQLVVQVAELASEPLTRERIDARFDALCAEAAGGSSAPLTEDALKRALRQLRTEVFCAVMERDLAGEADVAEVTGAMTDLAETAIQRSLAVLSAELEALFGEPRGPQGERLTLGVVGMGKLGGRELNVSSDIDLIFIYEEDGETAGGQRAPIATQEFFTRLGKRLIGALAEVTADGYVFRVDMRLRPNGDSGPLVCSLGMLEEYFYVQGREWERYAWIKGRLVSEGASESAQRLQKQLDALVTPFVYRRYLDFGVISAIRALHLQIRQEAQRRASMRPDKADDIKLGRGGIREIEFSAQVFQLIRGGQDAGFRVRPTLAVLRHAATHGLIDTSVCVKLSQAYRFLRELEHRLQYRNDAQTHAMPVDPEERAALARAMGCDDYPMLMERLDAHREFVEQQFDQIFADKVSGRDGCGAPEDGAAAWVWSSALADDSAEEALCARLVELGVAEPADLLARLRGVWQSSRYAGLAERSRQRFDIVAQRALEAARTLEPPERRGDTLARLFDLLEAVGRRGAYLALLTEYPQALHRVLSVLGASRWAAGYLRHPQLLDELLDDEALNTPFDWPEFKRTLHLRLAAADGVEQQMDLLRHAHQAEVFRILLIDLAGKLSVEHVSDRLSELADAVLDVTLEAVWNQLPKRHREAPRFAVIAYGKLGGKELGYASDLDVIFLYDDPDAAADIYSTYTRRLITWLTTATGAGTLFDIDLRLRPNGESGLLVADLDAFRRYQLREGDAANTAWVWEHQALTRARYCAGDAQIGAQFEAIREQVLTTPRDATQLAGEIAEMRERVGTGHPNHTTLFDLKHDRGGMVDIEFTVQYWVLLHAARDLELIRNTGNIALLREVSRLGLMSEAEAETVGVAYRTYRKLQHKLRLDGMEKARVEPALVAAERDAVFGLWERVFGES
ncbi:MAG: Glutamine synthetase adenylyl-L-tyrosine phosphorylase (EC / Glutamate-ammonia-ligase adenylyltransferase (EC [uncultured Paraburkholderia sp.]|nr:MAG: Glutamine synthetase adenylyl-L-tyrosine phosphorylase (EC / Glutamate-ammonia-ligase adenylyltransferase (EC [uncultured Paraburkholderia sp.]